MDIARSMLLKSNAPKSLWNEVVNTTNYLVNRLPTQVNQRMTPLQVFIGRKPILRHLHIFGCKAHVHVQWENRTKLEAKSIRFPSIGYDEHIKTYRLLNLKTNNVQLSKDVRFNEKKTGFTKEE